MVRARPGWPRWSAVLAAVVVAVVVPLALLGDWVGDDVVDRDGWVETLVPLAEDDRIVAAVAGDVTNEALELAGRALRANLPFVPGSIVDGLVDRAAGLITPIVGRIMETDVVASAWEAAVRFAHPQVLALLGRGDTALVDDGQIVLDLTPIADRVREEVDGAIDAVFGDIDLPFGLEIPDDPLGLSRLDVRFELVDLSASRRELGIADDAQRSEWLFVVAAVAAGLAAVLVAGDRIAGLALAAGAAALGPIALLVSLAGDRPDDPVGYGIAFDRIVDGATSAARVIAIVAGLVLVAVLAYAVVTGRTGRGRPARPAGPSIAATS